MNNIIMKLEDIDKFYMETGNKLHILKKLNLEVKRGEFVSIITKYNKFYNSNKEAPITLLLNGEERKLSDLLPQKQMYL